MVLKLQAGGDLSAHERWLSEAVTTGAAVGSRVGRQAMVFCIWVEVVVKRHFDVLW